MDRGAWWVIVHGVAKSQTRLSDFTSLQVGKEKLQLSLSADDMILYIENPPKYTKSN